MNVLRCLFYVDRMVHFVAKYDKRIEPPSKVKLLTHSISKMELLTHSMIGLRMHTTMWTRMDTSEIAGTPMDGDPEDNSSKYEN